MNDSPLSWRLRLIGLQRVLDFDFHALPNLLKRIQNVLRDSFVLQVRLLPLAVRLEHLIQRLRIGVSSDDRPERRNECRLHSKRECP